MELRWELSMRRARAAPAHILPWQQERAVPAVVAAFLVSLGVAPGARLVLATAALGVAPGVRART